MADALELEYWQFDYNWRRPHGSLGGLTPSQQIGKLIGKIPDREAVAVAFGALEILQREG